MAQHTTTWLSLAVMRPAPLALIAGIVPTAGIIGAFILSANAGNVPVCNPFWDGCASISATGRHPPGSLLFRAVEFPFSVVLVLTWFLCAKWLRSMGALSPRAARGMLLAGLIGALALIVYVTFLGTTTPAYSFMRRFGIYLYFLGTFVAQLWVALAMRRAAPKWQLGGNALFMLACCVTPFLLGLLNIVLKSTLANPDPPENTIEWLSSLSMQAWFLGLYAAWRRTDFRIDAEVTPPG